MPTGKISNRRALSCTSTRTHLEERRSVELRDLPFKPCPRKPRAGVSGALWRLPIATDVVPLLFFVFKCTTVYTNWCKTGMRGYFLSPTALTLRGRTGESVTSGSSSNLLQVRIRICQAVVSKLLVVTPLTGPSRLPCLCPVVAP